MGASGETTANCGADGAAWNEYITDNRVERCLNGLAPTGTEVTTVPKLAHMLIQFLTSNLLSNSPKLRT